MGKVPPRVPGRNAFPASPHGGAGAALAIWQASISVPRSVDSSQEDMVQFDVSDGDASAFSMPFPEEVEVADDGWYLATAWVRFDGNTTGYRELHIVKNGYPLHGLTVPAPADTRDHHLSTARGPEPLAAGDTYSVILWQTSGAGLDALEVELCVMRVT